MILNKKNPERAPRAYTEKKDPKGKDLDFVNLVNNVYNNFKNEMAIYDQEQSDQVEKAYNGLVLDWLQDQGIGIIILWDSRDYRSNYQLIKSYKGKENKKTLYIGTWYDLEENCIFEALKHAYRWIRSELEDEGKYNNKEALHEREKEKENQRLIAIFKLKYTENKQEKLDL
jgi:hypothetical protein